VSECPAKGWESARIVGTGLAGACCNAMVFVELADAADGSISGCCATGCCDSTVSSHEHGLFLAACFWSRCSTRRIRRLALQAGARFRRALGIRAGAVRAFSIAGRPRRLMAGGSSAAVSTSLMTQALHRQPGVMRALIGLLGPSAGHISCCTGGRRRAQPAGNRTRSSWVNAVGN